jgi:hypothetical protein
MALATVSPPIPESKTPIGCWDFKFNVRFY